MKRALTFLLILSLLLTGCSLANHNVKEPAEFYYPRVCTRPDEYRTYFSEGAIGSEIREASGHTDDLYYLLSMYLRGPLDPQLVSPFPVGCALVNAQQDGSELTVSLTSGASLLSDLDLSMACACIAKTCMSLTDAQTVRIESLGINNQVLFEFTITADSFLLEDIPPATSEPSAETE